MFGSTAGPFALPQPSLTATPPTELPRERAPLGNSPALLLASFPTLPIPVATEPELVESEPVWIPILRALWHFQKLSTPAAMLAPSPAPAAASPPILSAA